MQRKRESRLHQQPQPVTDPEATPKPPGQLPVQFAKEPDAVAWKNLFHSLMSGPVIAIQRAVVSMLGRMRSGIPRQSPF